MFICTSAIPPGTSTPIVGHRITSFNITSSGVPNWSTRSVGALATDLNLGLVFGESEETLYHFGK
jgi:hypothetical protein